MSVKNKNQVLALAETKWKGMWMNRQQVLSRLGEHCEVIYSEGPVYSWDLKSKLKFKELFGDFESIDNITLDRPPSLFFRYLKIKFYDDLILKIHAKRWSDKFSKHPSAKKILYVFDPSYIDFINHFKHDVLVYHCYDNLSMMRGSDRELILAKEAELCSKADFILSSSQENKKRISVEYHRSDVHFMPNGVDINLFLDKKTGEGNKIEREIKALNQPTAGYVGSMNDKFDFKLVLKIIKRMTDLVFVFIGRANNLSSENNLLWEEIKNQRNTMTYGLCDRKDVPGVLRSFNVNCFFYETSDVAFAKYCYPLKLHEAMASGVPIVSSPIDAIKEFSQHVRIVSNEDEWVESIYESIKNPENEYSSSSDRIALAKENSWGKRVESIAEILEIPLS